ncbi:MAG: hypothetical protein Q7R40_18385 [Phaeospirillum sp.]|nr:hypothetical protein [Phaeospirillum sp.]
MADHIQVGDATPRIQYVANGSQAAFTFLFPIFTIADMEVWLDNVKQAGSAYTISGTGISGGGTVLFVIPPANGALVTLRRRLTIARTSDYQDDGVIRAKILNDELDRQTAALQQVAEDANRSVQRSFLSSSSANLTLPEPSAGKSIKWNAAGSGLENSSGDVDQALSIATVGANNAAASAAAAAVSASSAQGSAAQALTAVLGGVKVSATDTTADTLQGKLAAGVNIALTRNNAGGDETLEIAVGGLGTASALASDSDVTLAADSDARLPTQKAVKAYLANNAEVSSAEFSALQQDVIQNYLLDAVNGAWAAGSFSNGGFDAFNTDTIGVNSTNQTYEAGKYYDNPGGVYTQYTPTGAAFGDMIDLGGLAGAFDGVTSAGHTSCAAKNAVTQCFVGKAFLAAQSIGKVVVYGPNNYSWDTYNTGPVTISIYGKSSAPASAADGILLASQSISSTAANQVATFSFAPASYQYVWVEMTKGSAMQYGCIAEVQYFTSSTPADMTLLSSALNPAPASAPTQVKLMALYKDQSGGAALNTDFTAEATRDGGATWIAGTLADTGLTINGFKALWTMIDVGAQPSGTAVKYRLKALNGKTQQVKAAALMTR